MRIVQVPVDMGAAVHLCGILPEIRRGNRRGSIGNGSRVMAGHAQLEIIHVCQAICSGPHLFAVVVAVASGVCHMIDMRLFSGMALDTDYGRVPAMAGDIKTVGSVVSHDVDGSDTRSVLSRVRW